MRSERIVDQWIGIALTLVGALATIWLSAAGKLTLYIHPRYTVFTVALAALAAVGVIGAIIVLPPSRAEHDHDHGAHPSKSRWFTWARVAVLVCAAFALLVLPPATLSSTTRQNRDLVTSGQRLDSTDTQALAGVDSTTFSVKDWAALLQQGGPEAVVGKEVDVSGYVLDQGEDDVFFVVRMMVSCCAVDAQPLGFGVYRPGWREELEPSAWIAITGRFAHNPNSGSRHPAVVQAASLTPIDEPDQPYVF